MKRTARRILAVTVTVAALGLGVRSYGNAVAAVSRVVAFRQLEPGAVVLLRNAREVWVEELGEDAAACLRGRLPTRTLILRTRECPACDATLSQLEPYVTGAAGPIVVATIGPKSADPADTACGASGIAQVMVSDPVEYVMRTGLVSVPLALVFDDDGAAKCLLNGVPGREEIQGCLEDAAPNETRFASTSQLQALTFADVGIDQDQEAP